MPKDPRVNRYRSGTHNPHQEVLVYNGEAGTVVYIMDWRSMRLQAAGVARPTAAVRPAPGERVLVTVPVEVT